MFKEILNRLKVDRESRIRLEELQKDSILYQVYPRKMKRFIRKYVKFNGENMYKMRDKELKEDFARYSYRLF